MYTTINYVFACKCMCMYVHTYVRKHGDCWIHIIKSVWVSVKLGTKMWMVRQASKTLSPELSGIGSKAVTYFRGMNMSGFQTHGHIWPESDSKKCHTITRQTQPVPFTHDLLSIWTEGQLGDLLCKEWGQTEGGACWLTCCHLKILNKNKFRLTKQMTKLMSFADSDFCRPESQDWTRDKTIIQMYPDVRSENRHDSGL